MKNSKVTFDLYLVCAALFGWILFTWGFYVLLSLESNSGIETLALASLFLLVVGVAFTASAARKPVLLVISSIVSCTLLTAFMLAGNSWGIWTVPNAALSFFCVLLSVYLQTQSKTVFLNS